MSTFFPDVASGWLEALPGLIDMYRARWELTLLPAFSEGCASWKAPVVLPDGSGAVLKLSVPSNSHGVGAAEALRLWGGRGAVRLLANDDQDRAMLVERCVPGFTLRGVEWPEASRVLCELLGQLWMMPPDPSIFVSLRERVADAGALTAQRLRAGGLRIDPGLLAEAAALPRDLSVSASGDRLLFGDLGVGNVLFSARGWLAIDPSPVFGDPAFDAARAIVQRNDFADVSGQISFLAGELGLDRVRVAAWVFSEVMGALGWCVEVGDADGVGAWLGCMREIVAARRSGAG